jgi:hypothetical protein
MGRSAAVAVADDHGGSEAGVVHTWRVQRLTELGLTSPAAEAVAESVDWHDVAKLVQHGCPAELAVAILN